MSRSIRFHHPITFASGVVLLTTGVLMHVPDFVSMQPMGYRMVGMPMSPMMRSGMVSIVIGLGLATFGLLPRWSMLRAPRAADATRVFTRAMDDAPLRWAHWWLLFVLGIALVIDVMKPATLGFVLPGVRAEYGITTQQAAMLPLVALTGTTIGSLLWGFLADRIGRRASILLAAMFFLGTSICGFMPSFGWNLVMCFMMGTSAGGMLPIVYALMAETVPAKMRGWLVILHGGLATALGYLAASGLAALLEPLYSWRILWAIGLPTGLLIVLMNRWIPESPRFLLEHGDEEGARDVMQRFGINVTREPVAITEPPPRPAAARPGRTLTLFGPTLRRHSITVMLYGLGWGLVNWGFVTFLPTILRDSGLQSNTNALLFYGALASVPGTVLVAYLYGRWSSRKSMIAFAVMTAASLAAFAVAGERLASGGPAVIVPLVAVLMLSSTAVISMLSPYAAEVYPTELRGRGSGLAAASSKIGGVVGPPVIGALLAASSSILIPALITAVPIALAALALVFLGEETHERRLEHISGE